MVPRTITKAQSELLKMRGFLVEDVVIKTRRITLGNLFEFSRLLNAGEVEVEMMWRRACCTVDRHDEP
jgi:hypothetical protein